MVLSRPTASRPEPTGPHRYGGAAFVLGIHLLAIWALSSAFVHKSKPAQPNPTLTPVVEHKPVPREPEPPLLEPTLRAPVIDLIPPPRPLVDADVSPMAPRQPEASQAQGMPESPAQLAVQQPGAAPGNATQSQQSAARNGPSCVSMPKPELPALNWAGLAILQAQAVVQSGRVVSASVRVTQGVVDARTRRALIHAVEAALAGYDCPGEQRFEQEFSFRVE